MGRDSLLIPAALLLAALAGGCAAADTAATQPERAPHAELACSACHNGALADGEVAAVPGESCTQSGCHAAPPKEMEVAGVVFAHAEHAAIRQPRVSCAGCHTHGNGSASLATGASTCGLCHEREASGANSGDCRMCHAQPEHLGMTNQRVPVPHQGLPWIEGGCIRCHYEVAEPLREVPITRCRRCHSDPLAVTAAGIGEDLHPTHTGVSCVECHDRDNHRIRAMSSAVALRCADCHKTVHEEDVAHGFMDPGTCIACHQDTHAPQQRLLLGIVPDRREASPAQHFMTGLTCRSCHIPTKDDPRRDETALRGSADACVACHRPEYRTVLEWWRQGLEARARLVEAYLVRAKQELSGSPSPPLRAAEASVELLRTGGGHHNLTLAHGLLEEALTRSVEAYRGAGKLPPPPPDLGRTPREGLCTYCHYRLTEPRISERMDDAFHRSVLRR